jgi:uncharacterized protein GlcG (DUF336 family)
MLEGVFVGAVGVSGGTTVEDVRIASAGVRAVGGKVGWEVEGDS